MPISRACAGSISAPADIDYVRAKNTDPRLALEQADAQALPFPGGSFDRAFSMLVLHFVPDPARSIREMRRVVRGGGTGSCSGVGRV